MVDLKGARYVSTLAECKSIRAAAEVLYISPPALSMYIRNLEQELGTALFIREHNRFVATEIGETYIRAAQAILAVNKKFESDLNAFLRKDKNKLVIGLYRRQGISFMVPLSHRLKQELPGLQFSFRIGSMQVLDQMLDDRQIDYMLVTHRLQKPGYVYSHVCNDELLIACPSSMSPLVYMVPESPYPVLPIERLAANEIMIPEVQQSIYPFIEQFLESRGINRMDMSIVANMEIAVQSVSAEMGVCFTLASYVPSFSHIPGIIFCRPADAGVSVSWSLATLAHGLTKDNLAGLINVIGAQTESMKQKSHL